MGIDRKTLKNIQILRELDKYHKLNHQDIANYLGMTRQSLSKIFNNVNVSTSKVIKIRVNQFITNGDVDLEKAASVIKFSKLTTGILDNIGDMNLEEIDHYRDIIQYAQYWQEEKNTIDKYMEKLNFHIQNFHMRTNPYYLYFHMFFHKDLAPLLTFDIDYDNNIVNNVTFGNIIKTDYMNRNYDLNYQNIWDNKNGIKSQSFEDFIDNILDFYSGKLRYNVYLDYIDNQFDYIYSNLSKKYKEKFNGIHYVDLSRIFTVMGDKKNIEAVMSNYTNVDSKKILSNALYRNKIIIDVIRIVSGYKINKTNKLDSLMKTSDSEKYIKNDAISKEIKERRKLRMGK